MQRVLPNLGGYPKVETSFQATGVRAGHGHPRYGHVLHCYRPDGTEYGEGEGVMTTMDGKVATWTGHGVGARNKDGTAAYRVALYLQTMPPEWARLNKAAVLFEYAVDAEGNSTRSGRFAGRGRRRRAVILQRYIEDFIGVFNWHEF
jgi:hypothetical protein